MIKLKIDNTLYEAADGATILEVARKAGLNIPTLCHMDGVAHYSSCMICMVKNIKSNNYIPSCTALVQDGMEIDTSGEDVISLRRKSLEMLFSEHRAECEAPCRVVCPAGYNIPLANRFLAEKKYDEVIQLTEKETDGKVIMCHQCPGYCENACRRKRVDIPVSIRNTKLFIAGRIKGAMPDPDSIDTFISEAVPKTGRAGKRFSSLVGRLEANELQEWLKECTLEIRRAREISDFDLASGEAASCMHCDCRASEDCRFRDLAQSFGIRDPRGKMINAPIQKKINVNTGLVFENAKCIKCGLCVRICEGKTDEPALCFINRGFISIISEPLTEEFNDILLTRSQDVIDVCPTGALSRF